MPRYWWHHHRPKRYYPHRWQDRPHRRHQVFRPRRAQTPLSTIIHNIAFVLIPLLIISAVVVPFFTVPPLVSFRDKVIAVISAPWIIDKEEARALCLEAFEEINNWRAEDGTPALIWDEGMYELATAWSEYMAETGDYRHSDYTKLYGYAECITNGISWGQCPIGITTWLSGKHIIDIWRYYGSYMHWAILCDSGMHYGAVGIDSGLGYATFLARW